MSNQETISVRFIGGNLDGQTKEMAVPLSLLFQNPLERGLERTNSYIFDYAVTRPELAFKEYGLRRVRSGFIYWYLCTKWK